MHSSSHIKSRYDLRHGTLLAYTCSEDIVWSRPCDNIARALKESKNQRGGSRGSNGIAVYKNSTRSQVVLRLFDELDMDTESEGEDDDNKE